MICMGFAGTGWSPSLHGPALLLVPTVFLAGGLPCPSETHCTIPTSALVFEGNIFTHPNNKKTKHGKRCRRFLHNGARACGSKVTSVYCTASLPCRRFLVSVLTTVQE